LGSRTRAWPQSCSEPSWLPRTGWGSAGIDRHRQRLRDVRKRGGGPADRASAGGRAPCRLHQHPRGLPFHLPLGGRIEEAGEIAAIFKTSAGKADSSSPGSTRSTATTCPPRSSGPSSRLRRPSRPGWWRIAEGNILPPVKQAVLLDF
jgi:hypothetical protein